jgi:hypothetical protein
MAKEIYGLRNSLGLNNSNNILRLRFLEEGLTVLVTATLAAVTHNAARKEQYREEPI